MVLLMAVSFSFAQMKNVKEAKSVAAKALLLSTLGVALTTGFVGVFVHLVLRLPWLRESFVVLGDRIYGRTSVFNILRTKSWI